MKLLNYTHKYLSIALFIVISIWAAVFYFSLIDEVRDSIDDGLENNKMLVIQRVEKDIGTVTRSGFSEHNYTIKEIQEKRGLKFKDRYSDTLMYTLNEEDYELFRMLTTVFNHQNKYYEMKVVASTVGEDDLISSLFYNIIGLYVVILVSILVINNLLLRKIWNPFYLLLGKLKSFRLDKDDSIRTPGTTVKEFRELNEAVNGLVEQSVASYSSQKQFIENAAHELQTPLAISLNRLELLAENEGLSDLHLASIGSVISTLQRLTRLNKSLLMLSKIENKQYGEVDIISVNSLVKTLIYEFRDFVEIKELRINLIENASIELCLNKDLAAIMFSNLIRNSISHNIPGGSIELRIERNIFTITNTGSDFPLDQGKIFKRFHKESKEKNSTGLGLAIVKAITDLYGYRLHYSFKEIHQIQIFFK